MFGFFAFLAAVPFIDRNPYLHYSKRKLILCLGFLFLATIIGLGVYSRIHSPKSHLSEMSDGTMTQMATADEINITHQKLYSEVYYLVPALLGIELLGSWLAFKVKDS